MGSAFADPDLVLMHPATLGALRRAKDAEGRYILDLLAGPMSLTAFGQPSTGGPPRSPTPTQCASAGHSGLLRQSVGRRNRDDHPSTRRNRGGDEREGWRRHLLAAPRFADLLQPLVADDLERIYSGVAEESIALSCPRPRAINIVTGLPTA